MANLRTMPPIDIPTAELVRWGIEWQAAINSSTGIAKSTNAFDRQQSMNFASFIDLAFGDALAEFLGAIPVIRTVANNSLIPSLPDCVEVGPVKIIGGIRPQNFDAAYRPDGPRVVFDSKTLNDTKSVNKNWQNMVNDLGTEATTVHTRYPYAIVAFMLIIPQPALLARQEHDIIRTLERLATRRSVIDLPHLAESISFVVWDPATGTVNANIPLQTSPLRIERMPDIIESIYLERYKGLPPHNM